MLSHEREKGGGSRWEGGGGATGSSKEECGGILIRIYSVRKKSIFSKIDEGDKMYGEGVKKRMNIHILKDFQVHRKSTKK